MDPIAASAEPNAIERVEMGESGQKGKSGSCRLELQGPYSRPSPVQSREGGGGLPLVPLRAIPRRQVPNPAAHVPAKESRRQLVGRKGSGKRETVWGTSSPGPSRGLSALCALRCVLHSAVSSLGCNAVRIGRCVRRSIRPGGVRNQSSHIRSAGPEGKRRRWAERGKRLTSARRSESTVPLLYTALQRSESDQEVFPHVQDTNGGSGGHRMEDAREVTPDAHQSAPRAEDSFQNSC